MEPCFDPLGFCPDSATRLRHDTVPKGRRCTGCGLQGPNDCTSPFREVSTPSVSEITDITSINATSAKSTEFAHRAVQALQAPAATHIPKRQSKIGGLVNQARQSSFTPKDEQPPATFFFRVSMAKPAPDNNTYTLFPISITCTETNRKLDFYDLYASLWREARRDLYKSDYKQWLHDVRPPGEWLLVYTLGKGPQSPLARVQKWYPLTLLSEVIAKSLFVKKRVNGNDQISVYFVWLPREQFGRVIESPELDSSSLTPQEPQSPQEPQPLQLSEGEQEREDPAKKGGETATTKRAPASPLQNRDSKRQASVDPLSPIEFDNYQFPHFEGFFSDDEAADTFQDAIPKPTRSSARIRGRK